MIVYKDIKGLAPGWKFELSEQPAGRYSIIGSCACANVPTITLEGTDRLALAWQAGENAMQIINDRGMQVEKRHPRAEYLVTSVITQQFPEPLKALLAEEILQGNLIDEEWTNFGTVVLLVYRFITPQTDIKLPLYYRLVADPHYWHEEVGYANTECTLAARNKVKP